MGVKLMLSLTAVPLLLMCLASVSVEGEDLFNYNADLDEDVDRRAAQGVPWDADILRTYFNGVFNNSAQIATGHDSVVARLLPLKLPVFGDQQAFFIEEVYKGVTVILQVGVVTQIPGNRTGIQLYDFMNYTGIEPLSYDTEQLSKLEKKDLRTDDDCYAQFEFQYNSVLTYTYPDCTYNINGKHPRFEVTFTDCRTLVVIFPGGNNQQVFSDPYIMRLKGERYPVTYDCEDYFSRCSD